VWANDPTTVGIVEAVAFCGRQLADVAVLSVGTTTHPFEITDRARDSGSIGWATQIIDTLMFGQVHGSIAVARCLLGDRFLRINADTPPQEYRMDDPAVIPALVRLGRIEAERVSVRQAVEAQFLNGRTVTPWFVPPTPAESAAEVPARSPAPPAPSPPTVAMPRPAPLAGATPVAYRQRLVVYVVWHPDFAYGQVVADALYAHLNRPPEQPGGGGLGIPVLFRSTLWAGEALPDAVRFDTAQNTAVVVLVDDTLVVRPGWREYIEQIWDTAQQTGPSHRVYPVKLSDHAFNLSPKIAKINYIRPFDLPSAAALALTGSEKAPQAEMRKAAAVSEPAARTRFLNAVVHELCRLLLARPRTDYGSAVPAELPAAQKLTIFLSHSKADGVPVARAIKQYIEDETHLKTFFDVNDIEAGDEFDPVIRREVGKDNGALLVVQTDAYGASAWCLEELLVAKAHRRPVLVVHAVATGEERGPVYAGNVPTRRHDPARYDRVVGRMLLEILRREHFIQSFTDLQTLFSLPADIQPLPYPPEPLTIADLKLADKELHGAATSRFVYPDPPLGGGELKRLEVLDSRITLTTPLLLLATESRSASRVYPATKDDAGPTPRLAGKLVGLSVGNSADLAPGGMGPQHLNEAATAFARYLLACGADLAYGGRPRLTSLPDGTVPPNFLDQLLDSVRAYNRAAAGEHNVRIRSFAAEAFAAEFSDAFRARWVSVVHITDVPAPVPRPAESCAAAFGYFVARSLTAMRQEMTRQTHAHVFLGGAAHSFKGKYPGLLEEAHLAMEAARPVYLIGAFGGATRAVIDTLEGRPTPVLTREWQQQLSPSYTAVADLYAANDPVDYQAVVRFFRGQGIESLSRHNGLSEGENRRLFETPYLVEMVYLVLLGLGRVFARDRE
jgi:hypothetical protein